MQACQGEIVGVIMVLSKAAVMLRLRFVWLWLVDLWEFLLLLTLGFHPARSIFSLHRDSKETGELLNTCLEVYGRSEIGASLCQLKDILSGCDSLSITKHTTDQGYNLLQLAVRKGDVDFAEYLLRERKVNPNICKCSLPLHIALSEGSVDMVQLLLTYKARTQQQAGMCHPLPHVPIYSSHSKFFFVSPSMVCGGSSKDSYQRAIDMDNVRLLQLLLCRKSSSRQNVLLLHYACDIGAMQCIRHLVEEWGADVNATDNKGCNAIMHSLLSDVDIIHYLVSKGADISCVSYQGRTALHRLYCNPEEQVPSVVEKTRLLLALGADNLVNKYDVFRNTALHYLCTKYALSASSQVHMHCLELLLTHNADTSISDSEDRLPLLTLLQCSCLNCPPPDSPRGHSAQPHHSPPTHDRASKIDHIIKLFSQSHLSSVQGVINRENETAMFYILRMCFDYEDLSYLRIIDTLQRSGANINHVAVTQLPGHSKPTKYTDISARSLLSVCNERAHAELRLAASESIATRDDVKSLVSSVLDELYRAGLDPNAQQIQCRTQPQAENINALACFTSLLRESHSLKQLALIEQWMRLTLQWGGNPDIQSYRPEPQICTSQGGIFLKQTTALPIMQCFLDTASHHWSTHPDAMLKIVTLLANSMTQNSLFQTVSSMPPSMSSTFYHSVGTVDLSQMIDSLVTQPRSLQAMACHQIYISMGRVVCRESVDPLPLPTSLKTTVSMEV